MLAITMGYMGKELNYNREGIRSWICAKRMGIELRIQQVDVIDNWLSYR
jgi:hypothetical protein